MTTSAKLIVKEHLDTIRRNAMARINWDGGCALPDTAPPDVIVEMCDEIERLRNELKHRR